ncbi:hypothetical protein GCM10010112_08180 [Actinoplanes lobatus]|nr:hypothetical protein GCM10010112_08180 [Actinoplanes lobatus]
MGLWAPAKSRGELKNIYRDLGTDHSQGGQSTDPLKWDEMLGGVIWPVGGGVNPFR